uniref:Uncharacterized protein n=1 Tax=Mustela putorius furo TaxID=9669 RepID=M3YAR2_MUSPF
MAPSVSQNKFISAKRTSVEKDMRIWENRALALSPAADSPARLPDASSVHPSVPRERHDASEPVSSPLSDQRAVESIFGVSASRALGRHHLPRAPPPGQNGNDLCRSGRSVWETGQT